VWGVVCVCEREREDVCEEGGGEGINTERRAKDRASVPNQTRAHTHRHKQTRACTLIVPIVDCEVGCESVSHLCVRARVHACATERECVCKCVFVRT
jgi:hypothetical protein